MTFVCPKCRQTIQADPNQIGLKGKCPFCNTEIMIPAPTRPLNLPLRLAKDKPAKKQVRAGWICFGIGAVLALLIVTLPLCAPLFIAAAVLGIIAMANGRVGAGLALLLCSLLIMPLIAIMVAVTAVGTAFTAIAPALAPLGSMGRLPLSANPPQKQVSAKPTVTVPVRPAAPITASDLLTALEGYGAAYAAAETTIQREQITQAAKVKAQEFLQNRDMILTGVIRDVRMPSEGTAQIQFERLDLGAYAQLKEQHLQVMVPGRVDLQMKREEALSLSPGLTIQMSGRPLFASSGNIFIDGIAQSSALLTVTIRGDFHAVGMLRLENMRCRIVPPGTGPTASREH